MKQLGQIPSLLSVSERTSNIQVVYTFCGMKLSIKAKNLDTQLLSYLQERGTHAAEF